MNGALWLAVGPALAGPLTGSGALGGTSPTTPVADDTPAVVATTGSDTSDATVAAGAVDLGDAAAAIVLGTTVDTVARPSSATDLAISVGGAFEDAKVPTSYAVEVSPYWIGKKSASLGFEAHVRGGAGSLARNFNVSFAASNDASDGIAAALAARTTWWAPPGKGGKTSTSRFARDYDALFHAAPGAQRVPLAPDAPACFQSLYHLSAFLEDVGTRVARKLHTEAQTKALATQTALLTACRDVNPTVTPAAAAVCASELFATGGGGGVADPARDATEVKRLQQLAAAKSLAETTAAADLTTITKAVVADLKKSPTTLADPLEAYLASVGFTEAFEGCNALLTRHQGWVVDLATGASIASPDTSLAGIRPDAVHAWVTPGWVGDKESVFVLGRFKLDGLAEAPTPGVDVGLGLGYRWSRWALELQGLVGLPIAERSLSARATIGADLLVSKGLWFTAAVGGALPAEEPGSFLTLAGVKLAVTRERTFETPTYADLAAVVP